MILGEKGQNNTGWTKKDEEVFKNEDEKIIKKNTKANFNNEDKKTMSNVREITISTSSATKITRNYFTKKLLQRNGEEEESTC